MPLVPPEGSPREKILVYGPPKVGKTSAHLSIAEMYLATGTPGRFFVIDTDDAMEAMLVGRDLPNVEVLTANEWPEYKEAASKAVAQAEKGDWIVVDFVDRAWTEVRDWYMREVAETNWEEDVVERARQLKEEGKLDKKNRMRLYEGLNWDVINPQYNSFIKPLVIRTQANIFLTCEEKEVWKDGKPTNETTPGGQKGLSYQVRTILKLDKLARGRIIKTQGDRERPELNNETYDSFAMTYLCKTAGWKIA
jgi:hypothetical protein